MKKIKELLTHNWFIFFCLLIIVIQLGQIIYFKRAMLSQTYDPSYWKDRFEHSQWSLPLSKRIIGDDGIYSYAGLRLIKGESIEATNANKPPVGIYLLGLSIFFLNNPLWAELLIGMGTIICFYFLALELLKDKKSAIAITTLLTLEPFIFSNFTITLLDLPQLFLLLFHLLLLLYGLRFKKFSLLLLLISGISLGLFTETKPPLLLPVIGILELIFLYQRKSLAKIMPIGIGFIFGILVPYLRYFQTGHNLVDYLKLHKYMASVYYSGHNQLFPLSIWQSIFIGNFPDVVTGKLVPIGNWWPLLPIIAIFGLIQTFKILITKKSTLFLKGLALFVLAILSIYTIIPSYSRYLVLALPFIYIFAADKFKNYINTKFFILIFIIISIFGLCYSSSLLIIPADITLENFKYNFSHKYFQDLYQEDLDNKSRIKYSQQQFRINAQKALMDATVENVTFDELSRSIPLLGNQGNIQLRFTYVTRDLGTFSQDKTILLNKEKGVWKVNWNWNLLLNSFEPGDNFKLQIKPGKRGSVYGKAGNIIISDQNSYLISINPERIDTKRENEMLLFLKKITTKEQMHLQNAYLENPMPNTYVDVATPFTQLTNAQIVRLNSYPGLTLTPYESRLYTNLSKDLPIVNILYNECCSIIYSSSSYHGIEGVEKKYDKELSGYNGGSLLMIDKKGKIIRTLINKTPKNGQDIKLP